MSEKSPKITLRDYQQEAVESIDKNFFKYRTNRQLLVLPTGAGKTVIMAAIRERFNKKTLILAHREELIQQIHDTLKLYSPDLDVGICKAEKNEIDKRVVVASVQSCSKPKRLKQLKAQGFDILMIDEAHHAVSDSYQKIINTLGFLKGSNKLLIGVTATPQRADKKRAGRYIWYDSIFLIRRIANRGRLFIISNWSQNTYQLKL